ISTGPYAIVRHPMYASALLYLAGTPLALGSYWGLVPLAATIPFLIWRLFDEETLLAEKLPGYIDYQNKVRYRLVPGIWEHYFDEFRMDRGPASVAREGKGSRPRTPRRRGGRGRGDGRGTRRNHRPRG